MKDLVEKNVQVKYNKELASLEVTFLGYITYEQMVTILKYEYAMIGHYKLSKCMIDLRKMGIYAPGVSELIKNEWFKQILAEGVNQVAFVVPENVFGQVSMNKAHEKVNQTNSLHTEYFQTLSQARQWMSSTQLVNS